MDAGNSNTTGNRNIGIGYDAMNGGVTTGDNNIAIGASAGDALTSGHSNIMMGKDAGGALTTGNTNVYLGHEAGLYGATNQKNIAIGYHAFYNPDDGLDGCVAIGYNSMGGGDITSPHYTIAIGFNSLYNLTSGTENVAIGAYAGEEILGGSKNVAIGYEAAHGVTSGQQNVIVGYRALYQGDGDEDANTCIGFQAGYSINDGNGNVMIGSGCDAGSATAINRIAIGQDATAQDDNSVTLGNASITDVYMGHDSGAKVRCGQIFQTFNGSGAWAASFYNTATDGHGMELGIGDGTSTNSALEVQNSAENATYFKVAQTGHIAIGHNTPLTPLHITQVSSSIGTNMDLEGVRVDCSSGGSGTAYMCVNAVGYAEFGGAHGDNVRSVAFKTNSSFQFWHGTATTGYSSGTEHFRIAADGTLTATDYGGSIGNISDERTKQNVQTYSGSLSIINTLRPVTYEWKSDRKNSGRHRGFIAQEVTSSDAFWVASSSVAPGQADWEYLEGTDSMDIADPTGSRTALVSKLTAKDTMYVSAIQELTQAVRDLRAQITGSTDLGQLKAFVSGSTFV